MTVSSFVVAFKRLRLNQPVVSPVYDRYSVLAVMEGISHFHWKVFWLVSVMSRTLTIMPSWNCRTVVMNLLGQPNFSFVFHKPSLLTVSKALVRSAKVTKRWLFCPWHFSPTVVSQVKRELNHFHWSKSVPYFLCSEYRLAYQLVIEQSKEKKGHGSYYLFSAFIPWYLTLNGSCSACLQAVMNN